MKIKIDSAIAADAAAALGPHARPLYDDLGAYRVGLVELKSAERVEPARDEDKDPSIKLKITSLEVAASDQEDVLRTAMQVLYATRTAQGTLDEDGAVTLDERALEATGGVLASIAAATARVALRHWAYQAGSAAALASATPTELRHELERIRDGLRAAAAGQELDAQ